MNEPSSAFRRLRAVVTPASVRRARVLALSGDHDQLLALTRDRLKYGLPPVDVLVALFCPALREIGEMWHANQIDPSQEATASLACDYVLDQVWPSRPSADPRRGTLLVAAPLGEQHSFAARLACLGLWTEGWLVLDLGTDVSVSDVEAALASTPNLNGVLLHAAQTSCLPAASAMIDAVWRHRIGVTVGGRGFGVQGCLGLAIGASAWAAAPGREASIMMERAPVEGTFPHAPARAACAEVASRTGAMVASREPVDDVTLPDLASSSLHPTRFLAGELAAAVLTEAPDVLADAVRWYREFLVARNVSTASLGAALGGLTSGLADVAECAGPLAAAQAVLA
ncbi:MAG: B12-binding domain-containing protein [Actinomycetota bacterium]|nr:B12-binding domain-containing protein [Actinomycetota bacterium]